MAARMILARGLLAALALSAMLAHACAQDAVVIWSNGKAVSPTNMLLAAPCSCAPLTPGQHNLAITSSTALTPPTGATYAVVQAKVATVSYTLDGTTAPTSSVGDTLAVGASLPLYGPAMIAAFRAISATGTLDVEYAK